MPNSAHTTAGNVGETLGLFVKERYDYPISVPWNGYAVTTLHRQVSMLEPIMALRYTLWSVFFRGNNMRPQS